LTPSLANEHIECFATAARFFVALRPAFRIGTVQHERADALRMTHGILDARRTALRNAEQREALEAHRIDERFEIRDLCRVG
jgi:hypothetical protein